MRSELPSRSSAAVTDFAGSALTRMTPSLRSSSRPHRRRAWRRARLSNSVAQLLCRHQRGAALHRAGAAGSPLIGRRRDVGIAPHQLDAVDRADAQHLGDQDRHAGVVIGAAVGQRAAQDDPAGRVHLDIGAPDDAALGVERRLALVIGERAGMMLGDAESHPALEAAGHAAGLRVSLLPAEQLGALLAGPRPRRSNHR